MFCLSLICTYSSAFTLKLAAHHKCPQTHTHTHADHLYHADMREKNNLTASMPSMIIWFNYLWLKTFILSVHSCGYWLWPFLKCISFFVINKPETRSITRVPSECNRHTAWQNQVRIAEENICHHWTKGLCAVRLQHDQSQLHLCNWLRWEYMEERQGGAGGVGGNVNSVLSHHTAADWTPPVIPHHVMQ